VAGEAALKLLGGLAGRNRASLNSGETLASVRNVLELLEGRVRAGLRWSSSAAAIASSAGRHAQTASRESSGKSQ
jgi:hypothetical protein